MSSATPSIPGILRSVTTTSGGLLGGDRRARSAPSAGDVDGVALLLEELLEARSRARLVVDHQDPAFDFVIGVHVVTSIASGRAGWEA